MSKEEILEALRKSEADDCPVPGYTWRDIALSIGRGRALSVRKDPDVQINSFSVEPNYADVWFSGTYRFDRLHFIEWLSSWRDTEPAQRMMDSIALFPVYDVGHHQPNAYVMEAIAYYWPTHEGDLRELLRLCFEARNTGEAEGRRATVAEVESDLGFRPSLQSVPGYEVVGGDTIVSNDTVVHFEWGPPHERAGGERDGADADPEEQDARTDSGAGAHSGNIRVIAEF